MLCSVLRSRSGHRLSLQHLAAFIIAQKWSFRGRNSHPFQEKLKSALADPECTLTIRLEFYDLMEVFDDCCSLTE